MNCQAETALLDDLLKGVRKNRRARARKAQARRMADGDLTQTTDIATLASD